MVTAKIDRENLDTKIAEARRRLDGLISARTALGDRDELPLDQVGQFVRLYLQHAGSQHLTDIATATGLDKPAICAYLLSDEKAVACDPDGRFFVPPPEAAERIHSRVVRHRMGIQISHYLKINGPTTVEELAVEVGCHVDDAWDYLQSGIFVQLDDGRYDRRPWKLAKLST